MPQAFEPLFCSEFAFHYLDKYGGMSTRPRFGGLTLRRYLRLLPPLRDITCKIGSLHENMMSDSDIDPSITNGPTSYSQPRMACTLCRRRKMRCNRQTPCDSCTRLGFVCIYENNKQHGTRKHRKVKSQDASG
jgi:hypothetical protein